MEEIVCNHALDLIGSSIARTIGTLPGLFQVPRALLLGQIRSRAHTGRFRDASDVTATVSFGNTTGRSTTSPAANSGASAAPSSATSANANATWRPRTSCLQATSLAPLKTASVVAHPRRVFFVTTIAVDRKPAASVSSADIHRDAHSIIAQEVISSSL